MHDFSTSWLPLIVTVVVGRLESTQWNTEQPFFNQVQAQKENRRSQLTIITVPTGSSGNVSGGHNQGDAFEIKPLDLSINSTQFPRETSYHSNEGNGGGQPPSQPGHTYNINHCPTCQSSCRLRPKMPLSLNMNISAKDSQFWSTDSRLTNSTNVSYCLGNPYSEHTFRPRAVIQPVRSSSQITTAANRKNAQTLREHEASHRGELNCSFCEKPCSSSYRLKQHEASHREEWTCSTCNKSYSCSQTLRRHEARMHGVNKSRKRKHVDGD